jgi:hypothetical protein
VRLDGALMGSTNRSVTPRKLHFFPDLDSRSGTIVRGARRAPGCVEVFRFVASRATV